MRRLVILCTAAALLCGCAGPRVTRVMSAFEGFDGGYVLYVSKRDFTLLVYERGGSVVARYPVAYGLNPDGKPKLHRGDDRTPEGAYRIVEILSMDADPSSASYRKLKRMNGVFFRARDGHYRHGRPSEDLGDNAYGPRFFLLDYPNEEDRARHAKALREGVLPSQGGGPAPIGHGIAIHGNNDPESIGRLATSGCVRMYNNDIVGLDRYIILGTPVLIYPE